jgi:glucose-6-phosphate isomerase
MSILTGSISLGFHTVLVDTALEDLEKNQIMTRIWSKDHTVWKQFPNEIADRLGWLHSPHDMVGKTKEIHDLANAVRADGYTHALLLGMGGSSLAPEVMRKTFGVKERYLDLSVLDSTDPGAVLAFAKGHDIQKTLYIVSTKSGGTVETFSFMKYFYNMVYDVLGVKQAGRHFIAITDPGSSLADIAEMYHFRKTFLNDPHIGGRYSALSYFGIVPAVIMGMNDSLFLERAMNMVDHEYDAASRAPDKKGLSSAVLGAFLGDLAVAGRNKATFVFSPSSIAVFGDWLEQLIAESTGKEGKGIVPVVGEPLGPVDVYGNDRVFVHMILENDETDKEKILSLEKAGHPVVRIHLRDMYDLGGQFFLWEMATAVTGHRLGINPFDQPDVEAAKYLTRKTLAAYLKQVEIIEEAPVFSRQGIAVYGDVLAGELGQALTAFMAQAKPGAYVALQAYVQPGEETDAALHSLSMRLRDRYCLATTVGYGPRFLHSTGQLHKGDGGQGLFIQITADDERDAPIPDDMGIPDSSITFGVLKAAQASGDRQALINAGRSVIRFHLGSDIIGGLKNLTAAL